MFKAQQEMKVSISSLGELLLKQNNSTDMHLQSREGALLKFLSREILQPIQNFEDNKSQVLLTSDTFC